MRTVQKHAKLQKPKPILLKIDPTENLNSISLPQIGYEVVTKIKSQEVFKGNVVPLPMVLLRFLNHKELMVFSVLLADSFKSGWCHKTMKEIALELGFSNESVGVALYFLRKMHLIQEAPSGLGYNRKMRKIDYNTVQYLNDLLQKESIGVIKRIRDRVCKYNLTLLSKADVMMAYDNKVLPPVHDDEEEEEYD